MVVIAISLMELIDFYLQVRELRVDSGVTHESRSIASKILDVLTRSHCGAAETTEAPQCRQMAIRDEGIASSASSPNVPAADKRVKPGL
jgi:hypothetical protein